ncbi:MAG: sulfotransferase [Parvularculaceae bacterium]
MTNQTLEKAMRARLSGDLQSAISLCRETLAQNARDAEAMSLLGVSLAEAGVLEEARPHVVRALEMAPRNWRCMLNYSALLEAENDLLSALRAAQEASTLAPDRFEVWGRLGDLEGRTGNYQNAIHALSKAVEINPYHPILFLRIAAAAIEIGDAARATSALDSIEQAMPGRPETLRLRAYLARLSGDPALVLKAAETWFAAAQDDPDARATLAYAHADNSHYGRAAALYEPLAKAEPGNAERCATLGKYYLGARDLAKATEWFQRAIDADATCAPALTGLGRIRMFEGDFEETARLCRRAISAAPADVDAFAYLTEASGGALSQPEIEQLISLANGAQTDAHAKSLSLFCLGDAYHARKEHEKAFKAWEWANAIRKAESARKRKVSYDPAVQRRYTDAIMRIFPQQTPARGGAPLQGPVPVFIAGMPRSGTTLLESALVSHPDVETAGEIPLLPHLLGGVVNSFADDRHSNFANGLPLAVIERIRNAYGALINKDKFGGARFVIDKQPLNFLAIGLIRQIFPEAPIVYLRRNPIETGFSIFRRNFSGDWMFAHDLADIGHYYGEHARLAAHWRNTASNTLFLQYEELIADFEGGLKKTFAHCGVEWTPAALDYYKSGRPVITFSTTQVRKPPSAAHLSSTGPYRHHLGPLEKQLKSAGVDPETGALKQQTT